MMNINLILMFIHLNVSSIADVNITSDKVSPREDALGEPEDS